MFKYFRYSQKIEDLENEMALAQERAEALQKEVRFNFVFFVKNNNCTVFSISFLTLSTTQSTKYDSFCLESVFKIICLVGWIVVTRGTQFVPIRPRAQFSPRIHFYLHRNAIATFCIIWILIHVFSFCSWLGPGWNAKTDRRIASKRRVSTCFRLNK